MIDTIEAQRETPEAQVRTLDIDVLRMLGTKPIQECLAVKKSDLLTDTDSAQMAGNTKYATHSPHGQVWDFD